MASAGRANPVRSSSVAMTNSGACGRGAGVEGAAWRGAGCAGRCGTHLMPSCAHARWRDQNSTAPHKRARIHTRERRHIANSPPAPPRPSSARSLASALPQHEHMRVVAELGAVLAHSVRAPDNEAHALRHRTDAEHSPNMRRADQICGSDSGRQVRAAASPPAEAIYKKVIEIFFKSIRGQSRLRS